MDDLAIPLTALNNQDLLTNLGTATGVLLDLVLGEHVTYQVPLVAAYTHLGGLTRYTGDLRKEIWRRIAITNQSFNKHRKILYHNSGLSISKKSEIFSSLILSRLLYGAESWYTKDQRVKDFFAWSNHPAISPSLEGTS